MRALRSAGRLSLAGRVHRTNERIRTREVRVIAEDGEQLGVLPTEQAIDLARERGLDLVEVAAAANPPVVRILDYGKFKYEQAKKENESRKRQKTVVLREVKMKPKIGKHDFDAKVRTAVKLLREGDKLKITVMFRGREITHPEIGRRLVQTVMDQLEETGIPLSVEKPVGMEGRFMSVIVTEDKVKAAALVKERERAAEAESQPADAVAAGPAQDAQS